MPGRIDVFSDSSYPAPLSLAVSRSENRRRTYLRRLHFDAKKDGVANMKPLVSVGIVVFLTLAFTAIAGGGIWLIYISVNTESVTSEQAEESQAESAGEDGASKVKVEAKEKGVTVEITTMIPGVVVFVFGAIGLTLMLIKVPVKQILSIDYPSGPPPGTISTLIMLLSPRITLSDTVEKLPILIWLFVRNRSIAERVDRD